MRFKIGDRVRVRKDLKCNNFYGGVRVNDEMVNNKGKILTIIGIDNGTYLMEGSTWFWADEMFESKEYTYEDLKKSPIGTKVTFEDGEILIKLQKDYYNECSKHGYYRDEKDLKGLKDNCGSCLLGKIIKIEEPQYTTVYKNKKEILDETEKRYLRGVIRPFRNKVKTIVKYKSIDYKSKSYIGITLEGFYFNLPYFDTGAMYNGMKAEQKYTLKELGL